MKAVRMQQAGGPNVFEIKDVAGEIEADVRWLCSARIPKLFFYTEPGSIELQPVVDFICESAPNTKIVLLGQGPHSLKEDNPFGIGCALSE